MKKRHLTAPKPATSRSIDKIDPYVRGEWINGCWWHHIRAHTQLPIHNLCAEQSDNDVITCTNNKQMQEQNREQLHSIVHCHRLDYNSRCNASLRTSLTCNRHPTMRTSNSHQYQRTTSKALVTLHMDMYPCLTQHICRLASQVHLCSNVRTPTLVRVHAMIT